MLPLFNPPLFSLVNTFKVWWQLPHFLFILTSVFIRRGLSSFSSMLFRLERKNLTGAPSRDLNSGLSYSKPAYYTNWATLHPQKLILLVLSGSRVWSWRGSGTGERWRRGGTIRTSILSTTGRTSTPRSTSLSTSSCDASASTSATGAFINCNLTSSHW